MSERIVDLPVTREPCFVGREADLAALGEALAEGGPGRVRVLHGLGGVGKTQLASEFCHGADDVAVVWWLPAADPARLALSYAKLGKAVGADFRRDADIEHVRTVTRERLEAVEADGRSVLLVFDNAEDAAAIRPYLPSVGRAIVTTRNADFGNVGPTFQVRVLARPDSVKLLRARAERPDDHGAEELAKALGDLPLALVQAAAVCRDAGRSFLQYTRQFETQWAELLKAQAAGETYNTSLAMTLEIGFRRLAEHDPQAMQLLTLAAFLHPDGVPRAVLADAEADGAMPQPLGAACVEPGSFDELGASLRRYSICDADEEGLRMHRLVAALARDRLTEEQRRQTARRAVTVARAAFAYDAADVAGWREAAERSRHALAAIDHAGKLDALDGLTGETAADLLTEAGRLLMRLGERPRALAAFERALTLAGDDVDRQAVLFNDVGRARSALGRSAEALEAFETSIALDQERHGADTPRQVAAANNYAKQLQIDGNTAAAAGHFQWVVKQLEAEHPDGHPDLAAAVNNLAFCQLQQDETEAAEANLTRAWAMIDESADAADPSRATVLRNLAHLAHRHGHQADAEGYARRAKQVLEAAYGHDRHPDVRDADAFLKRVLGYG